jgi:hypothetical protein
VDEWSDQVVPSHGNESLTGGSLVLVPQSLRLGVTGTNKHRIRLVNVKPVIVVRCVSYASREQDRGKEVHTYISERLPTNNNGHTISLNQC